MKLIVFFSTMVLGQSNTDRPSIRRKLLSCEAGSYMATSGRRRRAGLKTCKQCIGGRYTGKASTTPSDCFQCPSGKYASGLGNMACTGGPVCAAGKWGTMGTIVQADKCKSCVAGKYQPVSGQGSCLSCPSGEYSTTTDSISCEGNKCLPGKYGDRFSIAQGSCKTCPSGKFTDVGGDFECHACPKSKYQHNVGEASCNDYLSCGNYYTFDAPSEECVMTHKYIKELSYVAWGSFVLNFFATCGSVDDHTGKYLITWFSSMVIAIHSMVGGWVSDGSFYTMCGFIGGCYMLPIVVFMKRMSTYSPPENDKTSNDTMVPKAQQDRVV